MKTDIVKRLVRTTLLATLVLLASMRWAAALTIDNFDDASTTAYPPGVVQNTVGFTTVTDPGLTGVIGGVRTLTVTALTLDFPFPIGPDNVTAGAAFESSFFTYASSFGGIGEFQLVYDANGAGLNMSLLGMNRLQLTVIAADASSEPYDVTVTMADSSQSRSSTQTITAAGGRVIVFPMSDFSGLDLAAIQSISLTVFPMNNAADMELDRFDALPPSPPAPTLSSAMIVVLVGMLSLVGLFGVRRARSMSTGRRV